MPLRIEYTTPHFPPYNLPQPQTSLAVPFVDDNNDVAFVVTELTANFLYGLDFGVHSLDSAIIESRQETQPQDLILSQNYPNPFNSTTVIRFALPAQARG